MKPSKRRWADPDKRMEAAVRMRTAGWTLRRIAADLNVTHTTVRRDLERWEQKNVEHLLEHLGDPATAMFQRDVP
jgi:IS30 family transposase